ncbi:MAG: hypothetical protein KatS3mg042_1222 [Rhodothermaceae bacterium]|nr:MAG: hypothetical protein KatS3mg042_1222 [Rhodothermaceae bacterium]
MTTTSRPAPLHLVLFVLPLFLAACASTGPYVAAPYRGWDTLAPLPASALRYRAFLIGDAGAATPETPVLRLLRAQLDTTGPNAAVVFLGDNAYCCGLPDSGDARRATAEARLRAQIDAVRDFAGRVVFIPGNHDWNHGHPGGAEALRRQEAFLEAHLPHKGNVFLPDEGFPGPVEIKLADRLYLLALDTEWWLYPHDKPYGDAGDYDIEEDEDFFLELHERIRERDDDDLLIVGHHPLFSNGRHAGRFPLKQHLFPLTMKFEHAYLPLPVLGSLVPFYIRTFGGRQDLAHPRYATLRRALLRLFEAHDDGVLIYAAGHEHNLQYFTHRDQHHLISGSGSRAPDYAARGGEAVFTHAAPGFMVVDYYEDGSVWMAVWEPTGDGNEGRVVFRTRLSGPRDAFAGVTETPPPATMPAGYADSTVVVAARPDLAAGPVKRFFLGTEHRPAWTTPVPVPVLDVGRARGGLTPLRRGGGLQTTSLRLRGGDGHTYVLRSITKDPKRSLPPALRGTVADDVLDDQVAILHPYGAFIIPPLAEAAGVYHTNPELVYVPDDPRLGRFRDLVAGQPMMLEERPDDDMSDLPGFGGARDVIGSPKLFDEVNGDNDHRVDAAFFARTRLFDMYLSDWDRHRDQWRWAAFEPYELDPSLTGDERKRGKVYRPIPRDRDWAFNKMDGLFPSLLETKYFEPKFQDFDHDYGYLKGLNLAGLELDRRFTASLTRSDWIAIGQDLQARLTDDVIERALARWPEPIRALYEDEFTEKLRARRDRLPEVAERYYEILAEVVDVVGSHKHERFEVHRRNDRETEVVVYKTKKDGTVVRPLFRRTFLADETREIRLYGLGGNDHVEVTGPARRGPRVIAVGGPGQDTLIDRTRTPVGFYDTTTGAAFEPGPKTRVIASDDATVNTYDPRAFRFDTAAPRLFFGSNKDDGLFIGGGVQVIRHGFRKEPYARRHVLVGNFAAATQAFNLVYEGRFTDTFGPLDAGLDARVLSPNSIRNFLGLGNRTQPDDDRTFSFYQARLAQVRLMPSLRHRTAGGALEAFLGPTLEFTKVRRDEDRFIGQPQTGISPKSFSDQWFAGVETGLTLTQTDSDLNPRQGFRWTNTLDLNLGIENTSDSYARLTSAFAFYASPSISPQMTLAARVGVAHNLGDFPFYQANTLGGKDNLRGYRSTRFAGRTSFFQNLELRLELFDFSTYVARGQAGLLAFLDNGRVWTEADDDRDVSQAFFDGYHQGYGAGLWADVFDLFVLTATLDASPEDVLFTLRFGFLF